MKTLNNTQFIDINSQSDGQSLQTLQMSSALLV